MNPFDRGLPLNDEDCIDFKNDTMIRCEKLNLAITKLGPMIKEYLKTQNIHISGMGRHDSFNIIGSGVPCELLKVNSSGWQKGKLKIRVSVEFYPDEPESIEPPPSPLDDIRQSMI